MLLADLRRERLPDGRFELSATARFENDAPGRVWIRVADSFGGPDPEDASPFVAGLLPLCMRRGEDLEVQAPVSPSVLGSVDQVHEMLWSFYPDQMRPVAVRATARAPSRGPSATVSLFTRGLDSWYTVLTADRDDADRPDLSHLVFVPSADIWDAQRAEVERKRVATAAKLAGLPLLSTETNLREWSEPILGWNEYHGAFLAAGCLALGPSHVLIPSTAGPGELTPHGSHPMLDPLWSTERTTIVYHGEVARVEKARVVAKSPGALATLRTCWLEAENCGRCSKCLHTMAALELAGGLRDCATFPDTVDPRLIAGAETNLAGHHLWELVASRLPDDADGRAKRLAAELAVLRWKAGELARDCDALEARLGDREAVARAVPGLVPELRAILGDGRGLAARLGETLDLDAPARG